MTRKFPNMPAGAASQVFAALILPGYRRHIQHKMREEEAAVRLAATAGPDGHRAAFDEVLERMRRLGMTQIAALESVFDDVAAGRWRPDQQATKEDET